MSEMIHANAGPAKFENMVSSAPNMLKVFKMIEQVAPTTATVLISGETGTGKELVARAIHKRSNRHGRPFVAINCGALTDSILESELFGHERGSFTGALERRIGKFELASGGTLFLDEIGNISEAMQVKILRVIEEGELQRIGGNETVRVDLRILAATNANLAEEVKKGTFRKDLFYRLNVVHLHLPPLRERRSDIPLLARFFIEKYRKALGKSTHIISAQAIHQLSVYGWPGNVRELENVVEKSIIFSVGDRIDAVQLDDGVATEASGQSSMEWQGNLKKSLEQAEKKFIHMVLAKHGGRIDKSAQELGVETRTLHRKMRQHSLLKSKYRIK